jgi:hypothetical protein
MRDTQLDFINQTIAKNFTSEVKQIFKATVNYPSVKKQQRAAQKQNLSLLKLFLIVS